MASDKDLQSLSHYVVSMHFAAGSTYNNTVLNPFTDGKFQTNKQTCCSEFFYWKTTKEIILDFACGFHVWRLLHLEYAFCWKYSLLLSFRFTEQILTRLVLALTTGV